MNRTVVALVICLLSVQTVLLVQDRTEPASAGPAQADSAASANRAVKLAKSAIKRARRAESKAKRADVKAARALAAQSRTADFLRPSSSGSLSGWTNTTTIPAGQSGIAESDCEPGLGEVIVAGAYSVPQRAAFVYSSQPVGNGWHVAVDNTGGTTDAQARVTAICAKVGKAVAAPLSP